MPVLSGPLFRVLPVMVQELFRGPRVPAKVLRVRCRVVPELAKVPRVSAVVRRMLLLLRV